MRAELINPFMRSLQKTFTTMLNCPVRRTSLTVKEDCRACHEVSGVIGLTGKAVGAVVLSLSREVALKAASTLLCTEMSEINDDVLDAVGELTNMVAGGAKAELEEFQLAVSLPNVITGKQHEVHFPSNVTPISIHMRLGRSVARGRPGIAPQYGGDFCPAGATPGAVDLMTWLDGRGETNREQLFRCGPSAVIEPWASPLTRRRPPQNHASGSKPRPTPFKTAVPTVPSVIRNMEG